MLADGDRGRGEPLLLDGNIRVTIAMVMVVYPHVLPEDGTVAYHYPFIGIQRTVVVEEHVVADDDLSSPVYHQ